MSAAEIETIDADSSATQPILRVEDLVVEFRRGRNNRMRAVDGISLEMHPGEILGVVGESGSGKSTFGRVVAGFQRPTGGRVLLRDPSGSLSERRTNSGYRDAQMIFQDSSAALDPRLAVRKVIREALIPNPAPFGRRNRDATERLNDQVRTALSNVELPGHYADRRVTQLSGGEKQRVAIARALAAQPPLIVCDEAVSALDVAVRAITLNLLSRLRRETGVALLFISHDMSVVSHLADRVVVMHQGQVVESGSVEAVLNHPQAEYTQRLIASVPTLELES